MGILRVIPPRWGGFVDNSGRSIADIDSPTPWLLADHECQDAQGWDFRLNRPALAPVAFGTSTSTSAVGLYSAQGTNYRKPLLWGSPSGSVYHYSGGAWTSLQVTPTGATAEPTQAANGLGLTLVPFGGNTVLKTYNGSTLTTTGGSSPVGLTAVAFFRLSQRFLGIKAASDTLYWCALNDQTNWSTGDSGSEPVGNDRRPITTLGEGPGDYTTVFKSDYVFILDRSDPTNWSFRRVAMDRGAVGMTAWCRGPAGALFFAHDSGIWMLNGEGGIFSQPITQGIARLWARLMSTYPTASRHVSLAYHARNQELYATAPLDNDTTPRQVLRCYVPDGSWCVEETQAPGNGLGYGCLAPLFPTATGVEHIYLPVVNAATPAATIYQLNAAGARTGAFFRTKQYGDPVLVRDWGVNEKAGQLTRKAVFFFKNQGTGSALVTPTLTRDDGTQVTGTPCAVALAGTVGQPKVAEIPLPNEAATFLEFKVENQSGSVVSLDGFVLPFEDRRVGTRTGG